MAVLDDVLMMQKKNITHGLWKNGIQESNVIIPKIKVLRFLQNWLVEK